MKGLYIGITRNMQDLATEEIVVLYQNTKNERYLEEILERNKKLIIKWANSYLNIPNSEIEDLVSEGYIALIKAVAGFDIEKGYTFTTCLKGYVIQHYNKMYYTATRAKRNNFSELTSYDELVEMNVDSLTATTSDFSKFEILEYIQSLTDSQRLIVEYLMDGYSKSDIARALHIASSSVTYHIKVIRKSYTAFAGGEVA